MHAIEFTYGLTSSSQCPAFMLSMDRHDVMVP